MYIINYLNNSPDFGKIGKAGKGLGRGRHKKPFNAYSKKVDKLNKWHDQQITNIYNSNNRNKKEAKEELHKLEHSYNGKTGAILNKFI